MIRNIFPVMASAIAIGLALLIFILPTPASFAEEPISEDIMIENIRLFDGIKMTDAMSVHLSGGKIVEVANKMTIPSGARRIDGQGMTMLPGLIDAHTHSYGNAMQDSLRFGVTTQLDMFTDARGLRDILTKRDSLAQTDSTDLFSAGMMATVDGGHGTQFGVPIETLKSPADAAAWVKKRKAEGSDYIKLAYIPSQPGLPSLDRATAAAIIKAAHNEKMMAVAHISTQRAAQDLIEDGIDGLVHIFGDSVATPAFIALAKSKNVFFIPTLTVTNSIDREKGSKMPALSRENLARISPQQKQTLDASFPSHFNGFSIETAKRNTALLQEAGISVLAGSDAPNPGTAHGVSLHSELVRLVAAGLTPVQALQAATSIPAKHFGLKDRGVIRVGARADAVIVMGNPATDINAIDAIQYVIKNGHIVPLGVPEQTKRAVMSEAVFGDFEKDMSAIPGFAWSATDDSIARGNSKSRIERIAGGANGSDFALLVHAEIGEAFPYPWAGGGMFAQDLGNTALDISGARSLSFDIKGTPGTYRVMMFGAGSMGIPPVQEIRVGTDWQRVIVPLNGFAGFDLTAFSGFAIVAGKGDGKREFRFDNVRLEK